MKALVCEMCSSHDIAKQDGMYICRSCGTKYSTEEAKKLMIEVEGTVDVSGSTVKVDNSCQIEKFLENARRAMKKEDWDETEKYYNMVEQYEPANIEAIFYSAYAKAKNSLTGEDIFRRQSVFNSLIKSVSILDDNFDASKTEELYPIVEKMSSDVIAMIGSSFVFTTTTKVEGGIKSTSDNRDETINLFRAFNKEFAITLKNIAKKLTAENKEKALQLYDLAIRHLRIYADKTTEFYADRIAAYQEIAKICQEVKAIDPAHAVPDAEAEIQRLQKSQKSQHIGCFIGLALIGLAIIAGIIVIAIAAR